MFENFLLNRVQAVFAEKYLLAHKEGRRTKSTAVMGLLGVVHQTRFDFGTPVASTAEIPNKRACDMLEIQRFVKRQGLNPYKFNPFFPVNILGIMRGALAAQQLGCFEPYVNAV